MAGNRKHGFMRGNANGRRPAYWQRRFFCAGCQKEHGPNTERTGFFDEPGVLYCERAYEKRRAQRQCVSC